MKSVWLIESGSYSDYRVVGIFSTREKALLVANAIELNEYDINEWKIDPVIDELNKDMWQYEVLMLRDGEVERVKRRDAIFDFKNSVFIWNRPNAPAYMGKNKPQVLVCCVWAKDEKHAVKIANEIRTQKIANGEWK